MKSTAFHNAESYFVLKESSDSFEDFIDGVGD